MIQTIYKQWVRVPTNLGVPMCCFLHVNKPNTTWKPSKIIYVRGFGATKHKQTTKHVSFCTQNEQTIDHCGSHPTIPIWRWHHQSGLLFWAFVNELKPMFRYDIKLSMIATCPTCQFPHLSIRWIPCGLTNTFQKGRVSYQRREKGLVLFPTCTDALIATWVVISHSKC